MPCLQGVYNLVTESYKVIGNYNNGCYLCFARHDLSLGFLFESCISTLSIVPGTRRYSIYLRYVDKWFRN